MRSCASFVCSLPPQIGPVSQQKLHMPDVALRASRSRGKMDGGFSPEEDMLSSLKDAQYSES